MNGGISLSRNASSSSLNARSSADQAKSIRNLTISVRFAVLRHCCGSWTSRSRADQDALRDAVRAFLAGRGAEGIRAAHGRARRRGDHAGGLAQDRRPRLDGLARARGARRARARPRSTRSSCRRRWAARVFPGPFFSSAILATLAAQRTRARRPARRRSPPDTQRGTVALDEAGHGDPIDRVRVRADGRGTRYQLDGVKPMVIDGHTADWVLVPARTREGLQTFLVERPKARSSRRASTSPASSRASSSTTRAATLVGPPGDHAAFWRRVARRRRGAARRRAHRRERSGERARARLRAGPRGVRQAAVEVPGDAAQGRRHVARDRDRAASACTTRPGRPTSTRPTARSRPRWRRRKPRAPRTTSPPSASRSTAASATRGRTTSHVFLRRAKVNDLLLGAQSWQRDASPTTTSPRSRVGSAPSTGAGSAGWALRRMFPTRSARSVRPGSVARGAQLEATLRSRTRRGLAGEVGAASPKSAMRCELDRRVSRRVPSSAFGVRHVEKVAAPVDHHVADRRRRRHVDLGGRSRAGCVRQVDRLLVDVRRPAPGRDGVGSARPRGTGSARSARRRPHLVDRLVADVLRSGS